MTAKQHYRTHAAGTIHRNLLSRPSPSTFMACAERISVAHEPEGAHPCAGEKPSPTGDAQNKGRLSTGPRPPRARRVPSRHCAGAGSGGGSANWTYRRIAPHDARARACVLLSKFDPPPQPVAQPLDAGRSASATAESNWSISRRGIRSLMGSSARSWMGSLVPTKLLR